MMRDAQRIDHMLGFVRRCLEILDGVDEGMYLSSLDKQEQVELNMLHLGEAAARVSDEVKESHPDLPWHEMVGMRNVLTHEYITVMCLLQHHVFNFMENTVKLKVAARFDSG